MCTLDTTYRVLYFGTDSGTCCGSLEGSIRFRSMHNHHASLINISFYVCTGQLLDLSSPVTATASSWYVINTKSLQIGFPPQMAIQADTGQVTNTCFLSKMESQPWFTIEFKSVISIFNVRLVVRAETFSYLPDNFVLRGMDNLSVYVSNSSTLGDRNQQRCDNPWKYISTNNILLDCGENRSGRFVHVTVPSATPTYLLICSIVFNRETGNIN